MPVITPICAHRVERMLWLEERGDLRWNGARHVWVPSPHGVLIRTMCRRCGAFVGYRPLERERGPSRA